MTVYAPSGTSVPIAIGTDFRTAGIYYAASPAVSLTQATLLVGTTMAFPFGVKAARTIDRIGLEVVTGVATAVVRLGIYNDDGNGRPGSLLADYGTIDGSAVAIPFIVINQALAAGTYWAAVASQVAGTGVGVRTQASAHQIGRNDTALSANLIQCLLQSGVAGALPASFTADANPGAMTSHPRVLVRSAG